MSAWVPDVGLTVTQVAATLVPVPGQGSVAVVSAGDTVVPGFSVSAPADSTMEASKSTDSVHLADLAKCEVYVCFEGPWIGSNWKSPRKKMRRSIVIG